MWVVAGGPPIMAAGLHGEPGALRDTRTCSEPLQVAYTTPLAVMPMSPPEFLERTWGGPQVPSDRRIEAFMVQWIVSRPVCSPWTHNIAARPGEEALIHSEYHSPQASRSPPGTFFR